MCLKYDTMLLNDLSMFDISKHKIVCSGGNDMLVISKIRLVKHSISLSISYFEKHFLSIFYTQ